MNKKVLITGAGGYIGSLITQALSSGAHDEIGFRPESIIALDVRECPKLLQGLSNVTFIKNDVRSPELVDIIEKYKPDLVAHLASIVTPGKDSNREFEYSVDVLGTQNVLDACVKSGVKKVIITSSGAAYGYHADNPLWLREEHPLRGNQEFAYSYHKKLVEEMLAQYRTQHPDLKQLILRLGTVIGKTVKNQITNLFEKPVIMGIAGSDSSFTFIWDQDVVNTLIKGIATDQYGIYNLAGDGALSMREIAKILDKPYFAMPPKLLGFALSILKKAGLTQYGPEQIGFLRYRPILFNEHLKRDFPYTPKKTTKEAFMHYCSNNQND
jgi:UDP-glucose 4-epimerase